jgi:hypothetical protein
VNKDKEITGTESDDTRRRARNKRKAAGRKFRDARITPQCSKSETGAAANRARREERAAKITKRGGGLHGPNQKKSEQKDSAP